MSVLTIVYTPGYVWTANEIVTIAKLNLAANPTLQLSGTISSSSIADNAVTAAKINVSAVGAGLTGGGGTALAVAVDNITLQIVAGLVAIKGGITVDMLRMPGFQGASAYLAGTPGIVPQPAVGQQGYYLKGNGTWGDAVTEAGAAITATLQARTQFEVFRALSFN